jgi:hypothetical protein
VNCVAEHVSHENSDSSRSGFGRVGRCRITLCIKAPRRIGESGPEIRICGYGTFDSGLSCARLLDARDTGHSIVGCNGRITGSGNRVSELLLIGQGSHRSACTQVAARARVAGRGLNRYGGAGRRAEPPAGTAGAVANPHSGRYEGANESPDDR